MILGQEIPFVDTSATFKSPPFARAGQKATFSIDVQHKLGTSPSLSVAVQHKNHDDTTWATADSFSAITATGLTTKTIDNLKEQIRFLYQYTAGSAGDFFWVQVLAPVWQVFDD